MQTIKPIQLEELSPELSAHIVVQDYSQYTPIDQAVWRYILRVNGRFFAQHAHGKYQEGLRKTGLSKEHIPRLDEIDQCLQKFGWRAVAVSGFIPPAVFLELQAMGVLPIACDMRSLEHLAYTPAPDIVHEAAGHLPFIADPEYAEYLRHYGEIARKAIFSKEDQDVYEAIRTLSIVKEDPDSTTGDVLQAQDQLDQALKANTYVSEATLLSRMGWWSTEYGLISVDHQHRIFGAGLLSSVKESSSCLSPDVPKIPFTLDCIHMAYDITRPQPQLFVTQDFQSLSRVLDQLSEQMAYRRGGLEGLAKAQLARTVTTIVLDTGLQISGILTEAESTDAPCFIKLSGPVQLSFNDQEIANQGPAYHLQGFSSPLGPLRGLNKSAAALTLAELEQMGFANGQRGRMDFASGIVLEGVLTDKVTHDQTNLILSFTNCDIHWGSRILYRAEWGRFDLACGDQVQSVFGGAADRKAYFFATSKGQTPIKKGAQKTNLTGENRELNELYHEIRQQRTHQSRNPDRLEKISVTLKSKYPQDWLLNLEILELALQQPPLDALATQVRHNLEAFTSAGNEIPGLIRRGLELLNTKETL